MMLMLDARTHSRREVLGIRFCALAVAVGAAALHVDARVPVPDARLHQLAARGGDLADDVVLESSARLEVGVVQSARNEGCAHTTRAHAA